MTDVKPSMRQTYDKSSIALLKVDDLIMNELIKGIQDLKIKRDKL